MGYFIKDEVIYGGDTDFTFASVSAMNTAITNGNVPDGAVCYVQGEGIYKISGTTPVKYGSLGGGSGGGHTIKNASGVDQPQRKYLQFGDSEVTDDATNDITKINVNNAIQISWADYQLLSETEKNNGNVYYIPDYPGYGGVFYFNSKSAMDTAITNGDVPNGAVCLVGNDTPYVVHASDVVYGNSNVGTALDNKAEKSDLTSKSATGSTNNSGYIIYRNEFFYLDGVLCQALGSDIAKNAPFSVGANYKIASGGITNGIVFSNPFNASYEHLVQMSIQYNASGSSLVMRTEEGHWYNVPINNS